MISEKKRLWPLGIRWQLMIWYTSVFAALLFAGGLFFYLSLESSLANSFDTALGLQAQELGEDIYQANGQIKITDTASELPGFTAVVNNKSTKSSKSKPHVTTANVGYMVRLLDAHGNSLRNTPEFNEVIVPRASVTSSLKNVQWVGEATTRRGDPIRLYSQPLLQHGKRFAIIQVAQSLSGLHDTLKHITKELLKTGLLLLFFSAIGSYILTFRAFAPIHKLIQAARVIKGGDLRKRVPVPGAQDEVRFLAVTLNEMIAHLDEMFTRQRRFVADASHELRTPIAAIRSKTDVALLEHDLPDEYATVLYDINSETVRLSHLINDLLALARGDEGQTVFDQEPVELDSLVEMVAANAETLAAEREVALWVHTPQPVTILGDEARLIQMIINLLDNAILYTNSGGSVMLTVTRSASHAKLIIQDNGIGIPPEHLPHIFERFYRADPAHTRTERGSSGLGLSIVAWIIQAHKGTIGVESKVGQGTIFTVTLPLATIPTRPLISKHLTAV